LDQVTEVPNTKNDENDRKYVDLYRSDRPWTTEWKKI